MFRRGHEIDDPTNRRLYGTQRVPYVVRAPDVRIRGACPLPHFSMDHAWPNARRYTAPDPLRSFPTPSPSLSRDRQGQRVEKPRVSIEGRLQRGKLTGQKLRLDHPHQRQVAPKPWLRQTARPLDSRLQAMGLGIMLNSPKPAPKLAWQPNPFVHDQSRNTLPRVASQDPSLLRRQAIAGLTEDIAYFSDQPRVQPLP